MSEPRRRCVGVLGGTFDPAHCGHLRLAVEMTEVLGLDEMRLVPAARPPHRGVPMASPRDRLRMLELALSPVRPATGEQSRSVDQAAEARLCLDEREYLRPGSSYTIDTLSGLRAELGGDAAICFVVGSDAFAKMDEWRQWRQLPEFGHIVVVARPGWKLPTRLGALECWRDRFTHNSDTLRNSAAGRVCFVTLAPLDISATRIRALLAAGRSVRYLVPDVVLAYIRQQGLYGLSKQGDDPPL